MRRLLTVCAVVGLAAGALVPAADAGSRGQRSVQFPAHHTVRQGEWLWSIARHFMNHVYADYRHGHDPSRRAIAHEVDQIRVLNRDELAGQHGQVYPGQRLLLANSFWDVPDGKAGWGTGFTACTNERPPRRSRAPYDGMSVTVHLAHPPLASGRTERAVLVVTNDSDQRRRMSVQLTRGLLLDHDGRAVGGVIYTDAIGVTEVTIKPHSRARLVAPVRAETCGDVPSLDRRVEPGHYRLYGVFRWGARSGRDGVWASPANRIRVVRR
jgi:hypothetical protein